jgi:catechol 2,3-dioxygenase-like lactoylglutathione lyase family enzyme
MNEVSKAPATAAGRKPRLTPTMLNHAAYITHDVEATAKFYTEIMGMELASTIFDDTVPSTGDEFPYFHIFFRMGDGSTIAFFEAPGLPEQSKSSHRAYDVFNHIALDAGSVEGVHEWHEWLTSNGLAVLGPVDHKGIILSVYFHDPNGIRLEITTAVDPKWNKHTEQGYKDLEGWVATKKEAAAAGKDVSKALLAFIHEQRKRYD